MKAKITAIATAAALLALPAAASAHITVTPTEAAADSFAYLEFGVPHGCEDSPTTAIEIQIPEDVPTATPQRNAFWDVSVEQGPKEPVELHGEEITEGPSSITWTASEPLPADQLDVLGVSVRLPASVGETIYFPAIQRCEEGVTRWIQIPVEGESGEELDEPAPALTLTAAEGGHGAAAGAEERAEAAEADDGDDGDSDTLAIAALIVGGLGLLTGGTALVRGRHR